MTKQELLNIGQNVGMDCSGCWGCGPDSVVLNLNGFLFYFEQRITQPGNPFILVDIIFDELFC